MLVQKKNTKCESNSSSVLTFKPESWWKKGCGSNSPLCRHGNFCWRVLTVNQSLSPLKRKIYFWWDFWKSVVVFIGNERTDTDCPCYTKEKDLCLPMIFEFMSLLLIRDKHGYLMHSMILLHCFLSPDHF